MVEGEFYPSGRVGKLTAQQSKSSQKAASSGVGSWSEWTWDSNYNCESRWRPNPAKKDGYEWDYRQVVSSEATGSTSKSASGTADPASDTAEPASGGAGGKAASSEVGPWSEWTWNKTYNCESRYRLNPAARDGGYEWEYNQAKTTGSTSESASGTAARGSVGTALQAWSEWAWDKRGGKWYRTRTNAKGELKYDIQNPTS